MKWIVISIIILVLLTLLTGVMLYLLLKPTNEVESSKRIVDKFNTDNNQYTLTKMINFHKKNKHLKRYRI